MVAEVLTGGDILLLPPWLPFNSRGQGVVFDAPIICCWPLLSPQLWIAALAHSRVTTAPATRVDSLLGDLWTTLSPMPSARWGDHPSLFFLSSLHTIEYDYVPCGMGGMLNSLRQPVVLGCGIYRGVMNHTEFHQGWGEMN